MSNQPTEKTEDTITVKQLRAILFEVHNQDMTIAELRRKLFDLDDDTELTTGHWLFCS